MDHLLDLVLVEVQDADRELGESRTAPGQREQCLLEISGLEANKGISKARTVLKLERFTFSRLHD